MKHINEYEELFESSERTKKTGFVFIFSALTKDEYFHQLHWGICDSFYDFAEYLIRFWSYGSETLDENNIKNIESVVDAFIPTISPKQYDFEFWHGFIPKNPKSESEFGEIDVSNPWANSKELEEIFTNSEKIMTKNISGNSDDVSYISRGIEYRPDMLYYYIEDKNFNDIQKFLKMDDKKKKAIVTLAKTRGLI